MAAAAAEGDRILSEIVFPRIACSSEVRGVVVKIPSRREMFDLREGRSERRSSLESRVWRKRKFIRDQGIQLPNGIST
jgi:hypothetical protein